MEDWRWTTAQALGDGIGAGQIDPVDLCEVFLEAIDAHPARDRIYARVTADLARTQASAARDRALTGARLGPLDGVPVSWKDLIDTADIGTEAGTALMAGRVPDHDAQAVINAQAAGLVCLGKTHMSEIAFSGLGVNPVTATPPNVNDTGVAPGGSSSGAAASVAFGLAAAAVGSDTGGSVRVPAAWNDLVGYRPTFGTVPMAGTVPLCRTFDGIGPLVRSVTDAALMVDALTGRVPQTVPAHDGPLRLAVVTTIGTDDLSDAARRGFQDTIVRLKDSGHRTDRFAFDPLQEAFGFAGGLYTADAWSFWRGMIQANPGVMFDQIEERVTAGQKVLAADYIANWERLFAIRAEWAARMTEYDAVILPTVPTVPPQVDRLMQDRDFYKEQNLLSLRNTRIANLMDLPSVTLPTGVPSCGVMLCGRTGDDAALLRIARQVETILA